MKRIEIVKSFMHERLTSGGCASLSVQSLTFISGKMNFTGTLLTVVTAGESITEGE